MQDWIAGIFAVLGTLMVLAGATLIVLRNVGRLSALPDADTPPLGGALGPGAQSEPDPAPTGRRWLAFRLNPATQLITWGIVLLLLAAVTVDLITFSVTLGNIEGGGAP